MTYAQLIQPGLAALTIGAAVALAAWALRLWRRSTLPRTLPRRPLIGAAVALLAAVLFVPAIGVVPAGHRGVVYRWDGGVDPRERGEGVTLIVPWVQHLTAISVRTQKVFSAKVFAQSLDLQEITVVASVNYHVAPTMAAELYQKVGLPYRATVIQPALFQQVKSAVGQVKAENFASSRAALALAIQRHVEEQLARYGIIVEFVNIEDAIFDPAFVAAVKAKIIAEQAAKEQRNLIAAQAAIKQQTIINAQAEARSVLIKATAQAKANRRIAASVTAALLRWQWIVTWNGIVPSTLVGGAGVVSLFLNGGSGGAAPNIYGIPPG